MWKTEKPCDSMQRMKKKKTIQAEEITVVLYITYSAWQKYHCFAAQYTKSHDYEQYGEKSEIFFSMFPEYE